MTGRVLALLALIVSFAIPAAAQADVTPVSSGSTTSLTGPVTFSFTVPAGNDRFLAVGISTASNVTVASVNFGAQVLTRQQQMTSGAVRSETWSLTAPNPGTANVTVTLSGPAAVIAGATSFAGVDQLNPIIVGSSGGIDNQVTNSASFVTNGTVAKDGMFGTIVVSPAAQTGGITTQGSVDIVVADNRWATSVGTIRGAGSTRVGWTGANMSQNSGIVWRWTNQGVVSPYAFTWLALKSSTGSTPPAVNTPTATNITSTGATLGGTLGSTGGATITRRGVVYCRCADPVIGGSGVTVVDGPVNDTTGPFTVNASGLTASTEYTFKAFAANGLGTGYTAATNFTTAAPPNQVPTANAGGPYTVNEGTSLTLSGSGTDGDSDPLTYSWDVNGDGTYGDATGANPTLTVAQRNTLGINDGPTTFSVRLRVSDGKATTTSNATTLTVTNTVPDATVSNGGPVDEGSTTTVSFSNVTDGSPADVAAGFRYAYDFNNDNTYEVGGTTYAAAVTTTSATVPATFLTDGPGTRTVGMLVMDKDGVGHKYTTAITVNNVAPTATFASGAGATIAETAQAAAVFSNAQDPSAPDTAAGFRYAYDWDNDGTWDVGNGTYAGSSTSLSMTIPAQYLRDGPASVTVHGAIIDKDGGVSEYRFTINVTNVAPTATASNRTVQEGQTATVGLANPADSPADLGSLHYVYDLDNDGTDNTVGVSYADASNATTATVPANLTADGPATRTMRIRVIDKDGGSTVYTETVTVTNVTPTAQLANSSVDEGSTATVGATNPADAGDLPTIHYVYDLDGNATDDTVGVAYANATAATTAIVPANLTADGPATVPVRVRIIDKDGASNVYTANVTVGNVAPTATITGPDAVPSSGAAALTLAIADIGDDTLSSLLDWGDGTTETVTGAGEKTVNHTYTSAGAKEITLVATDSDGAKSAVARHTLTVAAVPAAPAPTPSPTVTPKAAKQTITGVKITPRCLRADDLRARIARTQTMKVRFSLATAAPVKFTLQRLSGKGGASKCPPARGVKHPDGKRVPGVYRPFTNKSFNVGKGANTVTVAATGRRGKRLAPGTYLLTVESGGVSARTKLWVLAN